MTRERKLAVCWTEEQQKRRLKAVHVLQALRPRAFMKLALYLELTSERFRKRACKPGRSIQTRLMLYIVRR